jgi:hypothetical protein
VDTETLPGVSPYVLRSGDAWCPRRLASLFDGCGSTSDFFARGRLRDALLSSATDAHVKLRRPERHMFRPTPELVDDERAAFAEAADGYIKLFGDDAAVAVIGHGADRGMSSPRNGVTIRGWLDLVVIAGDGGVELRQFELWHRPLNANPMESWEMLCAVARLRRWLGSRQLRIVHADLYAGVSDVFEWDGVDAAALGERFATRVAELRALADMDRPRPGTGCGQCGYVASCPALREGAA